MEEAKEIKFPSVATPGRDFPMRVLAVGAAGQFAGLVIPELTRRGVEVRGLVHKASDEAKARALGAAEVVVGELSNAADIAAALRGMDGVFYIAPAFLQDEGPIGVQFVQAAIAAGVRRFVFSSVIHPVLTELSNHAAKTAVEEALLNSSIEWVFLHPAMFYQNFAASWERISLSGIVAEPWSTETRFTRVDYRDVAEVAAIAMTGNDLLFGTFELCAAGSLNRHDVASLMSEVLGRPITGAQASLPMETSLPAELIRMFAWYNKHSLLGNPLTLRTILGREPRALKAYFEEINSKRTG